ncbi:MAG: hypothetical protein IJ756_07185 [Paludibacteraceae bacterium]|nr:hypothetical protein [Paludibacteraceae bacterium]
MLKKIAHIAVIGLVVVWLQSCNSCSTKPQTPSNRVAKDSTEQQLTQLSQQMANRADEEVARFIALHDSLRFTETDGFWLCKLEDDTVSQPTDSIRKGDIVMVRALIFDFYGNLLFNNEQLLKAGTGEALRMIDQLLLKMCYGDHYRVVVPWYNAYGASGNNIVKPYQNIWIDLKVTVQ